jgi:signal transduction histidine kinase
MNCPARTELLVRKSNREIMNLIGVRFDRLDKTRSRELGGTGLGLSIVKHLMMAYGGKMKIESRLGYGTTVSLFSPGVMLNNFEVFIVSLIMSL